MDIPSVSKITPAPSPVISVDNTPPKQDTTPEFHWRHKLIMYHNIRKALGYYAIWNIDSVTHFDEIAFEGYIAGLHYDYDYGYYDTEDITILIDKTDPTWFDIYKACNDAIVKAQEFGDYHPYIEEVMRQGTSLYLRSHIYTGS
jgi:hypothetical protein